jgi:transcriptional regulator with XRE-family HTH domain
MKKKEINDLVFRLRTQLKTLRESSNFTQRSVAKKLNIVPSAISKLENRDDTNILLSSVLKYVDALGYKVEFKFINKISGPKEDFK